MIYDLIVIGGGAAGFFGAIRYAERFPNNKVLILEKSARVLDKVRISGGGRCNVTHACWDPRELVSYYPRGQKAMLGPFTKFACGDMITWLDERGVATKIEEDGRIFPASDNSATIVNVLTYNARSRGVELQVQEGVLDLLREESSWQVITSKGHYKSQQLLVASGSSRSIWKLIQSLEIPVVPSVPSLFTFKIKDPLLTDLAGTSVSWGTVKVDEHKLEAEGPILITHWGLSGPGILKISAWGARVLHQCNYEFTIQVNWVNESTESILKWIRKKRDSQGSAKCINHPHPKITRKFWQKIIEHVKARSLNWADLNQQQMNSLSECLCACTFEVNGKSTHKDEFVSSGGVDLNAIDFKTMSAKGHPTLFLAGEVLDIDALTGGFNFQAAWTTSWIAAENMN